MSKSLPDIAYRVVDDDDGDDDDDDDCPAYSHNDKVTMCDNLMMIMVDIMMMMMVGIKMMVYGLNDPRNDIGKPVFITTTRYIGLGYP